MKKLVYLIILCSTYAYSQNFTVLNPGIDPLYNGGAEWGDFDNDGDLDLLMSGSDAIGQELIQVWQNDGSNTFTVLDLGTSGADGDVVWIDINQDGIYEILDHNYVQPAAFVFDPGTQQWNREDFPDFEPNDFIFLTKSDLLKDGVEEVIANGNGAFEFLFFTPQEGYFEGGTEVEPVVADLNDDGLIDILVPDVGGAFYQNTGSGFNYRTFGDIASMDIFYSNSFFSTAAGDINGDSREDVIAVDGLGDIYIYLNEGFNSFSFSEIISTGLTVDRSGELSLSDINIDGFPDIVISGSDIDGFGFTSIYAGSAGTFSLLETLNAGLTHRLVDFDGDNDLDIFIIDFDQGAQIYRNDIATNTKPPAPQNVSVFVMDNLATITYDPVIDQESNSASLYYQVSIEQNGQSIVAAKSSNSGFRQFYDLPNAGHQTQYQINLDQGEYVVQVQAIDPAGGASPFSTSVGFSVIPAYSSPQEYPVVFPNEAGGGISEQDQFVLDNYRTVPDVAGRRRGSFDYADFDNDGDLDLVTIGETADFTFSAEVYDNDGAGNYSRTNTIIRPLRNPVVEAVDYNNDGLQDIFMMGVDTSFNNPRAVSRLYKNYGDGIILETTSFPVGTNREDFGGDQSFTNNEAVGFDWYDYDTDGDQDLLLSGYNANGARQTRLYQNRENNQFSQIAINSTNFAVPLAGDVKWLDADNDGDTDFITAGVDSDDNLFVIQFRNDEGVFNQDTIKTTFWFDTAFFNMKIELLDLDDDRDWDMILSSEFGSNVTGTAEQILISFINQDGNFREATSTAFELPFTSNNLRSLQLLDLNDDDLVDAATNSTDQIIGWINDGAGGFDPVALVDGIDDYFLFTNIDADDSLELTVSGGIDTTLFIYDKYASTSFALPQVSNPAVQVNGNRATLSWDPVNFVYYNVLVFNQDGKVVWSGNEQNGIQTSLRGDFLVDNKLVLNNLADGFYAWEVQTIDYNGRTSNFVAGDSFEVRQFDAISQVSFDCDCEVISTKPGDFDGDGRYELLAVSASGDFSSFEVDAFFVNPVTQAIDSLSGYSFGSFDLFDFDQDGRLDIVAMMGQSQQSDGFTEYIMDRIEILYNEGEGSFTNQTIYTFEGEAGFLNESAVVAGDIDNDGDVDLVFSTEFGTQVLKYRDGSFNFDQFYPVTGIPSLQDINADGYADIFIDGFESTYFVNDKNGFFTQSPFTTQGGNGDPVWADYDADGDLDLIYPTGVFIGITTKFFENSGSGRLTLDNSRELEGYFGSSTAFDYNNDGNLDLLFSDVESFDFSFPVRVYSEIGDQFANANITSIVEWYKTRATAYDFDRDNLVDIHLLSSAGSALFAGQSDRQNQPPSAPTGLSAEVNGFEVKLNWSAATDDHTPGTSLRYNVRAFRTDGGNETILWQSESVSGTSLTPNLANAGYNGFFLLDSLADGSYEWQVQAIDANGERSPYSALSSFEVFVGPELVDGNPDDITCNNFTISYTANPDEYEYEWFVEGGEIVGDPAGNSINVRWDTIGPGQIVVINRTYPTRRDTLNFDVLESPGAAFSFGENIAADSYIAFEDRSSGDVVSWFWTFENGETAEEQNPEHLVTLEDDAYEVTLRVTAENGCYDINTANVVIGGTKEVNISALVTPNNDNYNDFLFIQYLDRFRDVQVEVYNAAGYLVYSSDNYSQNELWDFSDGAGNPLPAGNYMVFVNVPSAGISDEKTVTVLR